MSIGQYSSVLCPLELNRNSKNKLIKLKFHYMNDPLGGIFVIKCIKIKASKVRPVDGLCASSIDWGQMLRSDSHDPVDDHVLVGFFCSDKTLSTVITFGIRVTTTTMPHLSSFALEQVMLATDLPHMAPEVRISPSSP